jgi:hypothetical protein
MAGSEREAVVLGAGLTGAAIGFYYGGPLGAQAGYLGGVMIAAALLGAEAGKEFNPASDLSGFTSNREGTPIPILFGRGRLSGLQMHYKNFRSSQSGGGGGSGLGSQGSGSTVSYNVDAALLFCWGPVSKLIDVTNRSESIWGGGPIERTDGAATSITTDLGTFSFAWGIDGQGYSPYIQSLDANPPRFNRYCFGTIEDANLGSSPNWPSSLAFELARYPLTSLTGDSNIGDDANPAHVVFEILTNPIWGLRIPPAYINAESFQDAADQFAAESFGISFVIAAAQPAISVLQDIATWTNSYLFIDTDGRIAMALIRENQNLTDDDFIAIDDSHIIDGTLRVGRASGAGIINQLAVQWTDPSAEWSTQAFPVQNEVSVDLYGPKFDTANLSAITVKSTAVKQANRILYQRSAIQRSATFDCNQRSTRIWVGRRIRLAPGSWGSDESLDLIVTSVVEKEPESGVVTVTALEDVLAEVPSVDFGVPDDANDVDRSALECLTRYAIFELPTSLKVYGGSSIEMIVAAGQSPNSVSDSFRVYARRNLTGSYQLIGTRSVYVPAGVLDTSLSPVAMPTENASETISITLDEYNDTLLDSVTTGEWQADTTLMLVGEELISIRDVTANGSGSYTLTGVRRGVQGSALSVGHSIGSPVYFVRSLINQDNVFTSGEFVEGDTWGVQVVPRRADTGEVVSVADCVETEFTFGGGS